MGVQSLWDLLLPTAKRINLEDLRGQILAIDASIWMVKVQAIYSHVDQMLLSIFNKIIMLLRYGIRPVFVFDGQTLDLKRNTLEKRRRSILQTSDNEIRRKAQLEIVRLLKDKSESGKNQPLQ
jgi:DNA excision repair protein ERCC-5